MHDAVFCATDPDGIVVYVRADDGSAQILHRLAERSDVPAPALLDSRDEWLLLETLPGVPLHDAAWRRRPKDAARVVADALRRLERNQLRHGDMCLPNILGDLSTGGLSGIVDWGDAGRFDHLVDVASAIWSCGYNGYSAEVPLMVMREIGWPRIDALEVQRLENHWGDLAGPADPKSD